MAGHNQTYLPIKQAIEQFGTEDKPLTVFDVISLVEADGLSKEQVEAGLSNVFRYQPHVHRRKVPNPKYAKHSGQKYELFGYWWNDRYSSLPDRSAALRSKVKPALKVKAHPPKVNEPAIPPAVNNRNDAIGLFWSDAPTDKEAVNAVKIINRYKSLNQETREIKFDEASDLYIEVLIRQRLPNV